MAQPRFTERCVKCNKQFTGQIFNTKCDVCGGLIEIEYDLKRCQVDHSASSVIAKYRDLIPVHDPDNLISVNAGNTPCMRSERLGKVLGLDNLFLKDETKNPTGTVKDRPAEVVLSYFKERGVWHFTSSATGNSSTAFARACIQNPPFEHSIFVGERWLHRITCDAHERIHVWVLEGRDVTTLEAIAFSRKWERENNIPPEGGFFNIGRREGLKLAFLEAVDQVESGFDWYIQGVSTAMGAYGAFKGAREYQSMGVLDRAPKLGLVQEATCAPQVAAFGEDSPTIEEHHVFENPDGVADALLKGNPKDTYPYMYKVVRESGGTYVSVTREEIHAAREQLLELEGIAACCASSTTVAALKKMVASGAIDRKERVLAVITGSDRDPSQHIRRYTRVVRTDNGWEPAGVVKLPKPDKNLRKAS
ncbi:MAG: pyridoxal-phosphate dependent enzyme [Proteobacteria bacterium]|nr:pyridoxal-phosphate dependent enzyme [Pseudomonadota bacterium]